ncbi:nitrate- and nitrite sensing domain-containing protein [Chromatiaceae bacterium AAb-1]|nr:nitrate- and nitrite sensing domain-containing protein [Chromatiaceae bacterium AAb-1]
MNIHFSQATERFLLAAKQAETEALRQLTASCRVVAAISALIHQLQRERGISNIFLASGCERFQAQRQHQIQICTDTEQQLRDLLSEHYLAVSQHHSRVLHRISFSLQGLDTLPWLRHQTAEMQLNVLEITQAYCRLIASLLALVTEVAETSGEASITRLLVALFNLMQAKEYAGQERAWGAVGFAESQFDVSLCERLQQLQYAQQEHLKNTHELVTAPCSIEISADMLHGSAQLQQMRALIQRLVDGSPVAAQISEVWYELATSRIDLLYQAEQQLTAQLLSLTQQRLADTENMLKQHQRQLKSLAEQQPTGKPASLLFDPALPGLFGATGQQDIPVMPTTDGMLNHTFYDLLQEQAAHIRQMNEQLQEARQALYEQKQIDRAKLLLMQQLGLSEQQAYRQLQQKAMSSQQRLADVASQLMQQLT